MFKLDSFRRLIRDEGLLCGGSSGAAVSIALHAAATLGAGKKCVVILPDSVRNYMTKFLNDKWLADRDIIQLEDDERLWWVENDFTLKFSPSCRILFNFLTPLVLNKKLLWWILILFFVDFLLMLSSDLESNVIQSLYY